MLFVMIVVVIFDMDFGDGLCYDFGNNVGNEFGNN